MQNNDKLILGGHEFTSRFILGSGKFSLDLVKACVEKAEAQIITLAVRRANEGALPTFWTIFPIPLPCCPTLPVPETQKKLCALQNFPENLAAGTLSK